MVSPEIDFEAIPLGALFRHVGQPTKYKILSALNQQDETPSQLSETIDVSRSNITSQLSDLRKLGFVDYQREGRNHRYSVRDPLPTLRHEIILSMIDRHRTNPEWELPEPSNQSREEIKRKIQKTEKERLKTKLELWASTLQHPGLTLPNPTREKLKNRIKNLNRDLTRLEFKT